MVVYVVALRSQLMMFSCINTVLYDVYAVRTQRKVEDSKGNELKRTVK